MTIKYSWIKHPRTTNEKRQNQDGWCRAKRRPNKLVSAWDSGHHGHQKSWKKFRQKQYHTGGRGKKHTIRIDSDNIWLYKLEQYFENHGIPYHVEDIRESFHRWIPVEVQVVVDYKPDYHYKYTWKNDKLERVRDHQIGWKYIYEWKTVGYKKRCWSYTIAHDVTWWYDKDIGIDHILRKCRWHRR